MSQEISLRKQRHLEICLNPSLNIEGGDTGLSDIRLPHRAMPHTSAGEVSLETDFLGYALKLPVMISCMTGGSDQGRHLNRLMARAAEERGMAFGTGSIRIMLRYPETQSHFAMRARAPNIPILANVGAAQLSEYPPETILNAVKRIEADGLCVHLNAAQELFQEGGNRCFTGWRDGIRRLIDAADMPILVKETGSGIPPVEGLKLLADGVSHVDVAGAGGTDWVAVENCRNDSPLHAESFQNWGFPTACLLLAYKHIAQSDSASLIHRRLIASGGLRTPRDFAVSLACGAHLGAAALPFIRAAAEGGMDAIHRYVSAIDHGLRAAVVLTGSQSLAELRQLNLIPPPRLASEVRYLADEAQGQ